MGTGAAQRCWLEEVGMWTLTLGLPRMHHTESNVLGVHPEGCFI